MRTNKQTVAIFAASILLLIISTAFCYFNISDHQFLHWDDRHYVLNEPRLHSINYDNLKWMFTDFSQIIWHPVTTLSFALNFEFFGKNPISFKVINIFIHTINAILVYLIALQIYRKIEGNVKGAENYIANKYKVYLAAFISSLFFAIHPQHVESVIWIIERKDVLCALFYFLGILSYLQQVESSDERIWINITAILYVLAIMSKPMAITFPLTLILLDIFILRLVDRNDNLKVQVINLLRNKLALIIASLGFAIVTIFSQKSAIQELDTFGITYRLINSSISIVHYLYTLFIPYNLSPYYPDSLLSTDITLTSILPIIILIIICFILGIFYRRNKRYPLIALIFFIATMLPVVGIVKIGHAAFADRYTYIPSVSLHILVGYILSATVSKARLHSTKIAVGSIVLLYCSGLIFLTHNYITYWKNDHSLWSRVINLYPSRALIAYLSLGDVYYRKSQYKDSLHYYKTALAIDPSNSDTLEHIGKTYKRLKNHTLEEYYYSIIAKRNPNSARAHIMTGDYYYNHKQFPIAEIHYHKALQLAPTYIAAIFKNAVIDYITLNTDKAIDKINYILALEPAHKGALQLLAQIEFNKGRIAESVKIANRLLIIDSTDKFANDLLAHVERD